MPKDTGDDLRDTWRELQEQIDSASKIRWPDLKLPDLRPQLIDIEVDPDLVQQPANIRRLVEISNATNGQIVALARLMTAAAAEQHAATIWMVRLTWAIVALTVVLVGLEILRVLGVPGS